MAEQGSHKPRVGGSSPPAATTHLRLAVQQALPLLPLFLGPTHASPLRDGVDDADEGQGHGGQVRGVEFMIASYRTG